MHILRLTRFCDVLNKTQHTIQYLSCLNLSFLSISLRVMYLIPGDHFVLCSFSHGKNYTRPLMVSKNKKGTLACYTLFPSICLLKFFLPLCFDFSALVLGFVLSHIENLLASILKKNHTFAIHERKDFFMKILKALELTLILLKTVVTFSNTFF